MDPFDELLLKKYLNLNNQIEELEQQKKSAEAYFYSQTLSTRLIYDVHGIHSKGFRQDAKVLDYLEIIDLVDKRIERVKIKRNYFNSYLNSLTFEEKMTLTTNLKGMSEALRNNVLDEIDQIEAAICLREGFEVEEETKRIELSVDFDNNLSVLSDFFTI